MQTRDRNLLLTSIFNTQASRFIWFAIKQFHETCGKFYTTTKQISDCTPIKIVSKNQENSGTQNYIFTIHTKRTKFWKRKIFLLVENRLQKKNKFWKQTKKFELNCDVVEKKLFFWRYQILHMQSKWKWKFILFIKNDERETVFAWFQT